MRAPDVGQRIRRIRQKLGLTQAQFAERLGIIKVSVARYESGRIPRSDVLDAIAQQGGVSVEWLLHGPASETRKKAHPPASPEADLSGPLHNLITFLEGKATRKGNLSLRYRRQFEQRVDEVVSRIKRELEEYYRLLETESRTRRRSPRKRTTENEPS